MALLELLKNPSAFPIGRKGHSKDINFSSNESPFHLKRVEWDITNSEANPTFLIGEDHNNDNVLDWTSESVIIPYKSPFDKKVHPDEEMVLL